jgi:peroxiredoxin
LALLSFVLTLPVSAQQLKIGDAAPDFTLTALDGKQVSISSLRGRVILLDFWATWCAPCKTEVPRFVRFQKELGPKGFQVIGISMDDTDAPVRKFYSEFKMNYPVAMGTEVVATKYGGVLGLPLTFLIGRDGKIRAKYEGSADLDQMASELEQALKEPPPRR